MKILFAGDFCVSRFEKPLAAEEMYESLADVKPVFDAADFSMLNLECVLYDGDNPPIIKSGPNLKGKPEFVECLNFLGIDVAGLANNHTGDYGDEAVLDTIKILKENNIAAIGAGKNIDEAYRPYIFQKDGLKVAVIAACENEFGIAGKNTVGAAGFNLMRVVKSIKAAKEQADKVIFFFHGGNEQNPFPSPAKTELYRHITDLGADAVIAMHTHCPQGWEYYNGKPIIYSMGNFWFPTASTGEKDDSSRAWHFGYMTELDITRDGISVEVHPYHFGTKDEPKMTLLKAEQKNVFMDYLKEISEPIADEDKIQHLFNIWCTITGLGYSDMLKYSHDMETEGAALCCHMKNDFSCEAHNELCRNTLDMCYANTVQKYIPLQDEIKKYQKIHI